MSTVTGKGPHITGSTRLLPKQRDLQIYPDPETPGSFIFTKSFVTFVGIKVTVGHLRRTELTRSRGRADLDEVVVKLYESKESRILFVFTGEVGDNEKTRVGLTRSSSYVKNSVKE